jgi:hypothetical protein
LHARGGAVLNAILLSVDDDGILVDRFCGDWGSNSIPALDGVLYFQWRQVDSVVLHAPTAVTPFLLALIKGFLWMIPSVLVGGAVGVEVCGQGRDDRDCVSSVATVAGSIGFLVGTIFNWPDTDQNVDRAYHPFNHDERAKLRVLCLSRRTSRGVTGETQTVRITIVPLRDHSVRYGPRDGSLEIAGQFTYECISSIPSLEFSLKPWNTMIVPVETGYKHP